LLEGWEFLGVGVVVLVILLWGPAKIPELAKALGRAKGEFDKASKEFTETASSAATTPVPKHEDVLIETAKKLGISTEGKTKAQISGEIADKVKTLGNE